MQMFLSEEHLLGTLTPQCPQQIPHGRMTFPREVNDSHRHPFVVSFGNGSVLPPCLEERPEPHLGASSPFSCSLPISPHFAQLTLEVQRMRRLPAASWPLLFKPWLQDLLSMHPCSLLSHAGAILRRSILCCLNLNTKCDFSEVLTPHGLPRASAGAGIACRSQKYLS